MRNKLTGWLFASLLLASSACSSVEGTHGDTSSASSSSSSSSGGDTCADPPPSQGQGTFTTTWSLAFGDSVSQSEGMAVGLDPSGNTIVAGGTYGQVDLSPSVSVFSTGLFLAAIDPSGVPLWASSPSIFPAIITMDPLGFIWTTASFGISQTEPTIDKLGPDGQWMWSVHTPGEVLAISPTGDGGVVALMPFSGFIGFGDESFTTHEGVLTDTLITALDSNGDVRWATTVATALPPPLVQGELLIVQSFDIAAASDGGAFVESLVIHSVPSTGETKTRILRRHGPNGELVWSKHTPMSAFFPSVRVVARPDNGVLLVAEAGGGETTDLGCGSHQGRGITLAALNAAGDIEWERFIGGDMGVSRPVVDHDGNITLAGPVKGAVDFGGGPLMSASSEFRIFVARYASNGAHLGSRTYEGAPPPGSDWVLPGECRARGVAADGLGNVVLTGYYAGALDLGKGPLPDAPILEGAYPTNGLVARIAAQ